ncbi:MAG TPA: ATP-binding cassette domain-containing protein [Acidobacteriaceae bacterium]|nr:ATP-binding cassette domain-containing protein [Acidobacteriaceae bacterium]
MSLVEVENLVKTYPVRGGGPPKRVVDDVSFRIERGQTLGIVGESGSGKSTVARLLLRLIEPDSGAIRLDGQDLLTLSSRDLRHLRQRMQIVFQDSYAALNPRMRVEEIVGEPLIIYRKELQRVPQVSNLRPEIVRARNSSAMAQQARILEALRTVGLDRSALPRYPHEFSGGQRQRINLARALILRPELVVLDEPTSALDVSVSAQIMHLLRELQRELHLTYIFITHSMPLVRYMADEILVLRQGRMVEQGGWQQICEHPQSDYTRALLAATPELPSAVS